MVVGVHHQHAMLLVMVDGRNDHVHARNHLVPVQIVQVMNGFDATLMHVFNHARNHTIHHQVNGIPVVMVNVQNAPCTVGHLLVVIISLIVSAGLVIMDQLVDHVNVMIRMLMVVGV